MVVVTVVAEEDMDQVMAQDSVEDLECHVPIAVVSTGDGKIFYIVLSCNPLTKIFFPCIEHSDTLFYRTALKSTSYC